MKTHHKVFLFAFLLASAKSVVLLEDQFIGWPVQAAYGQTAADTLIDGSEATSEAEQDQEDPTQKIDELPEILTAIAAEREALNLRATELDDREAGIELAAAALDNQIAQLESLQKRLEALVGNADGNQTADVERLVNIYRNMKPVQAGAIMNDMDIEVSVLVLSAMDEKLAGPIIANMNVVRAQAISKIIFERSRLPGNQKLINVRLQ